MSFHLLYNTPHGVVSSYKYGVNTNSLGGTINLGSLTLTMNSNGSGSFSFDVGIVSFSFDVENISGNAVITKAELSTTYSKVVTTTIALERDQDTGTYSGTVSGGLAIPSKIPGSSYVNKFLDSKINPNPITFDPPIDNPCVLIGAKSSFTGSACSVSPSSRPRGMDEYTGKPDVESG